MLPPIVRYSSEPSRPTSGLLFALLALLLITACTGRQEPAGQPYVSTAPTFCTDSAYAYVAAQCAYGPRTPGSPAHDSCGAWIAEKFRALGADVTLQQTTVRLYDGTTVPCTNIIATCQSDAPKRVMFCAHWDSRPWADNSPDSAHWHQPIDGANDGASGVAVLIELARLLQQTPAQVGVDLVCFDVEDCGTPQWEDDEALHGDRHWCLGSQYWAAHPHEDGHRAEWAVLLDMVGGPDSEFRQEGYSRRLAPRVLDKVWGAAHRIGLGGRFPYTQGSYVTDDHLPVNQCGIPCIDLIASDKNDGGFCTTWHTPLDDLSHIDRQTLADVGQTLTEVLYTEQ